MEDRVNTNTKARTISVNVEWTRVMLTVGLIVLGVAIPQMGLPQAITGPLVNALLLLAVETVGVGAAVLVGLSTPLSALANGVLPLPLMVMIPFIGIANAILSTVYGALKGRNRGLALVAGAALKFVWLFGVTAWLTAAPLQVAFGGTTSAVKLPPTLVTMMQWPQLATALAGGLIALGAMEGVQRLVRSND
jgi:hypothetical protein